MAYVRQDLIIKAYTDLLQREGEIFVTDVTDALMAVPLENVVPVEFGEWIRCGDGGNVPYLCSHCGKTVPAILVENWAGVKYCPMCGAKMDMVTECNQVKDGDGE